MKNELLLGGRVLVCNKELNGFTTGLVTTIKDDGCYIKFKERSNKDANEYVEYIAVVSYYRIITRNEYVRITLHNGRMISTTIHAIHPNSIITSSYVRIKLSDIASINITDKRLPIDIFKECSLYTNNTKNEKVQINVNDNIKILYRDNTVKEGFVVSIAKDKMKIDCSKRYHSEFVIIEYNYDVDNILSIRFNDNICMVDNSTNPLITDEHYIVNDTLTLKLDDIIEVETIDGSTITGRLESCNRKFTIDCSCDGQSDVRSIPCEQIINVKLLYNK